MFNKKESTQKKYRDFQEWKSTNLSLYLNEEIEVLKKIKNAIVFRDNKELSTFIKYYFGINFERQYFIDVFLNKNVVNYNKLINESINYLMSK
jgi:hypothetical protein